MRDWLNLSWKVLVARGVVGIVFGIVAMVWPTSTVIAFAILWGIWALVDAAVSFYQAFETGAPTSVRLLAGLMGLVALLAGLYAVFSPSNAAAVLTWVLGVWLIVRGVFELIGAFSASAMAPRGLLLLSAALDLLLGILFVANPGKGAVAIAFVLGLVALVWGLVFLVVGLVVRKQATTLDEAPGSHTV